MGVVRFGGVHRFLDSSLHFLDLRGRNVLLNVARWLVALSSRRVYRVYVNVEVEDPCDRVLREVAYLVYPARVEVDGAAMDSSDCVRPGEGACSLCGRPGVVPGGVWEWYSHVARGETLDVACLVARLFGRAANRPAFLFVVSRSPPRSQPDVVLNVGAVKMYFWRHGAGVECFDDTAALCLADGCVGVVGVRGNCIEGFGEYAGRVRRARRFEEVAVAREEFLRALAEKLGLQSRAVYQPRGGAVEEGFVPHLSGVNAGGREVDTELLAALAGSNLLFLVRVDGDRFGQRSAGVNEEALSQFKSAVSGVFEAGAGGRYYSATLYAGGDENMFVASGDASAVFSVLKKTREFFQQFLGTTISAGVVALRYKAPMYHAVALVNRAADVAKEYGRDAVALIYMKSLLAEEVGVVKFPHLDTAVKLARRYAEERPVLDCLQAELPHALGAVPASAGLEGAVAFILNTAPLLEI